MFDPLLPIRTDADLIGMADDVVGLAIRRQTWVLLLDDEHRPVPLVVPMDGVPVDPDPEHVAKLADRVRLLVETMPEAASAVLVWERPGSAALRMPEADWIAALDATDAPIRAQLLSSDDGVRLIDPSFEAIVA